MAREGREWSPRGPEGIKYPFKARDVIIPEGLVYPDHALEVESVFGWKGEFTAFPVGGGDVMRFGPKQMEKYRFRKVQPQEMELPWRRGKFWMDFLEKEYPGWTTGDLWNGWATPYFEKAEAEAILKESAKMYKEIKQKFTWSYDPKKDAFKMQSEHDEEPDVTTASEIGTPEGFKTVYGLGAYSWTWSEGT